MIEGQASAAAAKPTLGPTTRMKPASARTFRENLATRCSRLMIFTAAVWQTAGTLVH